MPIATRPGETFRVSLKKDKELHAGDPGACPFFEFRAVSCLEWKKISRFRDDPKESSSGDQIMDALASLIAEYLTGWDNMTESRTGQVVAFEAATAAEVLMQLLSMREMWELFFLLCGQGVDTDALKN